MPWLTSNAMKERSKFALEWETRWEAGDGRVNVAEACRVFEITSCIATLSARTDAVWCVDFKGRPFDVPGTSGSRPTDTPDSRMSEPSWTARTQ